MTIQPKDKIWIYLSDKAFTAEQTTAISQAIQHFLSDWQAHGESLNAYGEIRENQVIVIGVSADSYQASGCSIDKQLKFIKEVEKQFGLSLLNRLIIAYPSATGQLQTCPASHIPNLLQNGTLNAETPLLNTVLSTGEEFLQHLFLPLGESWAKKYLPSTEKV